jgi:hypothetical protein
MAASTSASSNVDGLPRSNVGLQFLHDIASRRGSGIAFSPDSASVAYNPGNSSVTRLFLADRRQVIVASGVDIVGSVGWGSEEIVYTRGSALWMVSAQGGRSKQLTVLDTVRHEVLHTDPVFPDRSIPVVAL